ncbi:MAG: small subunit ribosomal protein S15 [Rickettsiales bacterium]|jgi:small subunit ribosomal protein S15
MTIKSQEKQDIIKEYSRADKDSGSSEVQVAVFTKKIKDLTEHLKIHKKDFSSRRGLLIAVNRRKRLLDYLKSNDQARYEIVIAKLGLRK